MPGKRMNLASLGGLNSLRFHGKKTETQAVVVDDDKDSSEDRDDLDSFASQDTETRARRKAESDAAAAKGPEPDLLMDTMPFCAVVAIFATLNLQVLASETDLNCHTSHCPDDYTIWTVLNNIFTAIFVFEIILRMAISKPRRYFCGERTRVKFKIDVLNCLDVFMVGTRVLDVWILAPAGIYTGLRVISAFRILHLGPFVKQVQLNRTFRELWLVIAAIGETLKTLLWVGLMIFLVTWVCAILVTMATLDNKAEDFNFNSATWTFDDYWGSVPKSAYSLFQVITKDSWAASLVWPLVAKNNVLILLFGGFFMVAGLALMNAIIGVVVECTLSSSKTNAEKEYKEKMKVDQLVMDSLKQIFHDADTDYSGELDRDELAEAIKKRKVRDRLKMLQIPFKDLDLLFTLLDEQNTGNINTDMFFRGCARLRGVALASDLHQMSIDLNRHLDWCDVNEKGVGSVNDCLAKLLDDMDSVDIDIVRGDVDDKDPVLVARRGRQRASKAEVLRGKWADGMPTVNAPDSEWDDKAEAVAKRDKNSKERSAAARRGRSSILAANLREAGQVMGSQYDGPLDQPPPPPMPLKKGEESPDPTKPQKSKKSFHTNRRQAFMFS